MFRWGWGVIRVALELVPTSVELLSSSMPRDTTGQPGNDTPGQLSLCSGSGSQSIIQVTWCGMCWWRSLAQWALEWSMARAKGWNRLNVGIIIPQLYNMNVYTFSNFFRHKFKCLLEYLGTKDNIKLNCGIIVSPYHTIGKPTSIAIIVLA